MGRDSAIAWTDHTFNPWWGCVKVSEGCQRCYAEGVALRLNPTTELWGPHSTRRFFQEHYWNEPVRWNRAAEKAGTPAKVFCGSMCDVFEDRPDLKEPRRRLFDLIEATPWLIWQLLTKRPEAMHTMAPEHWQRNGWPAHVWAMASAENQKRYEERSAHLIKVPAATRGLSIEPLIGEVDILSAPQDFDNFGLAWSESNIRYERLAKPSIHWMVLGGESGRGCRPCDIRWLLRIARDADGTGAAIFVKQLGGNPVTGVTVGGKKLRRIRLSQSSHGHDEAEFPAALKRREFPPFNGGPPNAHRTAQA